MSTIPVLDEEAILAWTDERSFERGQSYYRSGAIFDARRQGMTLKARCRGSMPSAYRVEASFGPENLLSADCSCPVGGGGGCKHVVALLLTWRAEPEAFTEVAEVEHALEQRSKAELIAIIEQMLRQEPDLEWLLAAPLPVAGEPKATPDPKTFRRQAADAFHEADYEEWGAGSEIGEKLEALKEIGDGFLQQGNYPAAAEVYRPLIEAVMESYESYLDDDGALSSVVSRCVEGMRACLAGIEDGATHETILRTLFEVCQFDIEAGGIGFSEEASVALIEDTTPEERRVIAGWVREAMPGARKGWGDQHWGGLVLELEAETLDDESYLRICRDTGRLDDLVTRLLELGRLSEAVSEVEQAGDYDVLRMADLFLAQGHGDVAEGMVLLRSEKSEDSRLLEWLKQRYVARDDKAAALEIARKLYRKWPSLSGYREIRALAQPLDRWEALRPKLLHRLEEPQYSDLRIRIDLDEGEIDRALEALKAQPISRYCYRSGWGSGFRFGDDADGGSLHLDVAKAAEAERPRQALAIYQETVEALIALRGRENYQAACRLLPKVQALYERLGENQEWERYLYRLRESNRSLRALKEEMAAAKL